MFFCLILLISPAAHINAGVTDIPPISATEEVSIETVTSDTLIPANIFDATVENAWGMENSNNPFDMEAQWLSDSSPIFKAIRDFIFQDELTQTTESSTDGDLAEVVKIIEKGIIEATTALLSPSDDETISSTAANVHTDPITILKIEEESNNFNDRIGLNSFHDRFDLPKKQESLSSVFNVTVACSNCYESLDICVKKCFSTHNCNDIQRQVRMCPPSPSRLCNFFTQWSPVDECKAHEDCKSPLLCCNDGCVNKCSPGI